jgi:poly(A) polymerase
MKKKNKNMKTKPTKLSKKFPYPKELVKIKNCLLKDGDEIRLVGGCIRDFLAKKTIFEIDLATKYKPEKTMELLKKAKIKVIPTGLKHGTITAIIGTEKFEITTLRKDLDCDGRHAKVKFTEDYIEDAKRRDFTINAMYLDFSNNLYDYFDGQKDLKNGLIKFIGKSEERIKEDYLRILRFFRFYCYYGKKMDAKSLKACIKHKAKLTTLSAERIKFELFKILNSDNPLPIIKIMNDEGILQIIFDKKKKLNLKNFTKLINEEKSLEKVLKEKQDILLRFSMLIEDGKPEVLKLTKKLKLSNAEKSTLLFNANPLDVSDFSLEEEVKELLLDYTRKQVLDSLLINTTLDSNKKLPPETITKFICLSRFIRSYKVPKLPVTGDDIQKLDKNIKGRAVGDLLKKARKIWIESDYKAGKKEILKKLRT